ncbi:MAG: glycosyltransferase family 39 protein [Prosthecobacter sp.]|nr:glycosyltransferase family 39 protein [Prosthecobacter sp.]
MNTPLSPSLWQKIQRAHLPQLFLLAAIPWLLYSHTLHHESVLDDEAYVMQNPLIMDAGSFLYPLNFHQFINSYASSGIMSDVVVNFALRPISYLTFFLNYSLGGIETAGYRLVNISLHMLNGMLLYGLALRLTGRRGVALMAALAFAAHPLATESVTYIAQRFELMVTLFTLGALLSWVQARGAQGRARLAWGALSLGCTLLAMLSKESGVLVPLLLVGHALLERREPVKQALWALRGHLLLLPLLPGMVLACHLADTQKTGTALDALHLANVGPVNYAIADYARTQVCAWMDYLRLILLPVGQSFDHDYPLVQSVFEADFLCALAVTMGLLGGAIWAFRRCRSHGGLILAGLLWFFLTLAPSSSIVPLPDLFSEHRSYLPSIGILLALAGALGWLRQRLPDLGTAWQVTGLAVVSSLALATLVRNEVMRTRESIWQDALAKGSERARVLKGLGIAAHNSGRMEEAVSFFRKATEKHPEDMESWVNYCTLLINLGDRKEAALAATEDALEHWGTLLPLVNLRAAALASAGRKEAAEKIWRLVLQDFPGQRQASLGLAQVLAEAGHREEALRHLRAAERTGPLPAELTPLKEFLGGQLASLP